MTDNRQSIKKVAFHRSQVEYLERIYGTYADIAQNITTESSVAELNRLVGRQEVIDHIRKLVGGVL
jgi:hypothetical protein